MAPGSSGHTALNIRLTEPYILLVGGPEHERARARRRRALRQATTDAAAAAAALASTDVEGAGQTPNPSRPGSRAPSPAPPTSRGRQPIINTLASDPDFVAPRGRSASRNRSVTPSRARSASARGRGGGLTDEPTPLTMTTGSGTLEEAEAADEPPPAMLRGLLTLTLAKPTRIREISIRLRGLARTDWPEGIGPRRMDVMEETTLTNITATFYSATNASMERRAASIGPGTGDHGYDRSESRGRASRRAASMLPSRDTSRGRTYLSRDSTYHDDDPAPLQDVAEETAFRVPLSTLSRIASSTDLEQHNEEAIVPPVQPWESAPAYEAVDSRPSSPVQLPTRAPRGASVDAFDLSRTAQRNSSLQARTRLDGSPTPSRSPLGVSTPRVAPSPSPSNDSTPSLTRIPTTSSRLSQESTASDEALGPPSQDFTASPSPATSLSDADGQQGWNSAPVPGSTTSSFERGRPPTRDNSRGSGGDGSLDGVPDLSAGPTFQSRASNRQSPSPSLSAASTSRTTRSTSGSALRRTTSNSSSTRTAGPATTLPSALRNPSAGGAPRATSSRGTRFSLSGLSEALRGKSTTRATKEESLAPPVDRPRRATSPDTGGRGTSRNQSRGRKTALKVLRDALTSGGKDSNHGSKSANGGEGDHDSDDEADVQATGWKEFRAGTYTYPISIAVPASLPPTIVSEFGHVAYSLKATVHRAGALTSNLTASTEVTLVSAPGQDDTEENESIVVERFWETQMKYHVALSGKSFPIGGQIPISIRLHPMAKVKLYRVSAVLEQKTNYFASGRKLTRHETPKKYPLLRIEQKDIRQPLLPILSDDASAITNHPLAEFFINPTSSDDTTPSLLDPIGPWNMESFIQLPDCSTKVSFSTNHDRANITVSHILKIMLRVERGDDDFLDSKGKRKLWDVIIESPIHILSCHCTQNLLPAYSPSAPGTLSSSATLSAANPHVCGTPALHTNGLATGRAGGTSGVSLQMSIGSSRHQSPGPAHQPQVATLAQNLLFARLVAGQETPAGEVPPTYDEAEHQQHTPTTGEESTLNGSSVETLLREVDGDEEEEEEEERGRPTGRD